MRSLLKSPELERLSPANIAPLYQPQFFLLWFANFFAFLSLSVFFLFPIFIMENGGSKSDIGILMGAMMLSSVFFRPWVSQMVDRIGRKRSYFLGTLILIFTPLVHISLKGDISGYYGFLALLRIIHGVGIGIGFTAAYTFISDIIPENRLNEGLGIFGINGLIGLAAGPAIAEPIIRHFGFTTFFITSASMGVISLVLQRFLKETYIPDPSAASGPGFFTVLKRKKVLGVVTVTLFFGMGLATQSGFVSPYVQFLGLPNISIFFLAYSGGAILTRIWGSRIADQIGEERIVPWAIIINAFGYLILIAVNSNLLLILAGFVTGAGHGFLFPCLNALAIRHEPVEIRGKISGIFTGSIDSGNLIGSLLMGYIGEWFGFRMIFLATFLLLMAGFVAFAGFLKKVILLGHHQSIQ